MYCALPVRSTESENKQIQGYPVGVVTRACLGNNSHQECGFVCYSKVQQKTPTLHELEPHPVRPEDISQCSPGCVGRTVETPTRREQCSSFALDCLPGRRGRPTTSKFPSARAIITTQVNVNRVSRYLARVLF